MKKIFSDPHKRSLFIQVSSVVLSALFLGAGSAFFMKQYLHPHTSISNIAPLPKSIRKLSPTPTKKYTVEVNNDKQLMTELISQNLTAIQAAQIIINSTKNQSLKTSAQDIINLLQKENKSFDTWLSSKYDIEYNLDAQVNAPPKLLTTTTQQEQDQEFKAYMTQYYGVTSDMIMQVKDKDIPVDIKAYLAEAIILRKKQFYILDNIKLQEASPSATMTPKSTFTPRR